MQKIVYTLILVFFMYSANAQLQLGDVLPTIKLENAQNETISISSLKGKMILVDFWASWCGQCRVANRKLVKLHATSNDKIEIIGISLDKDPVKWMKAIEKDKIKYTQLIDPKGFDAETAQLFGVADLPSTYLFNADGILIAINPSEEHLTTLIN